MTEWRLPPDYILANWTSEMFSMMIDKLVERKRGTLLEVTPVMSDDAFFNRAGIKHVKVKNGDNSR